MSAKVKQGNQDQTTTILYILIAVMVFFTTGDLISGACNQLTLALICSSLSGLAVFIGAFKDKKMEYEDKTDQAISFIKSNFNLSSIILSALDIICSTIALLTTIAFIGLIFRTAFILRFLIKVYKYRTVVRAVMIASFIYLSRRNTKAMKLIKNYLQRAWGNKVTGILAGIGFAGIAYFQDIIPFAHNCIYIAIAVFVIFFNVGIYFGGEYLDQIKNRLADAVLKKEEKAKVKAIENKAKELANLQKEQLLKQAEEIIAREIADAQNKTE